MKAFYNFVLLAILCNNALNAQNIRTICEGDSTQLTTAVTGLDYSWTPSGSLSNAKIRNPFAKPTQTTTYISTVYTLQQNILNNSNFNQGNSGFTSDYVSSSTGGYGKYNVTDRGPQSWWSGFSPCVDHTTGTGFMMLIDGGPISNQNVWCQQVAVLPNTDYAFSAWVVNMCTCGAPPILQFGINGVNLGNVFNVTTVNCQWNQFYEIWNSGNNTTAKICLVNQNTNPAGNDFALDDITFTPVTPSHDTIVVNVLPKSRTTLNTTMCKGDSILFNNKIYTTAGAYTKTLKNALNCDSIVTLNLSIRTPAYEITKYDTICRGSTYNFAGKTINTEGVYKNCFTAFGGGDSVVTLHLSFYPNYNISRKDTICYGDSLLIGRVFYKNTGNYTIKLTSNKGCDSTINLNLTVRPQNIRTQKVYMCHTDFYPIGNSIYNKTGIYRNVLKGFQCDSTVITDLEVFIKWTDNIDTTICANQKLVVNNKTYTKSGRYSDTIPRPFRCDTIFNINLTVLPLPSRTQDITLCKGQVFKINNKVYSQSGSYTDTLSIKSSCDSVIITRINILDLTLNGIKNITVQNGDSIKLMPIVNFNNNLTWLWSPPFGLSCTNCATPILTPLSKNRYHLMVTDKQFGCTASDSFFVNIIPCTKVYIPNAFSPNDDNINDVFTAYGSDCAKGIKQMRIYNRWGSLVYSVENIPLGNTALGWNGKYKDKALPLGVYVYVIEIEYGNGTTGVYSGDISLMQ